MIVRESPKSKAKTNQPSWPPQSATEALLSSPSGRRKYEERRRRNSVSPSPTKRHPMSRGARHDDDEDEDEETLQLQLQAIEAKLKLKALRRARRAAEAEDSDSNASSSREPTAQSMRRTEISRPEPDVQVPHSPVRKERPLVEQRSPARVLLGIDKGWKAADVSLKRPGVGTSGAGGLSRSKSVTEGPKIKSFSERMAESRNREKEREVKETKIKDRRSHGFGLQNIEGLKERAESRSGSLLSSGTRGSQDLAPPSARAASKTPSRSASSLSQAPTPRPGSTLSSRPDFSRTSSATSTTSSNGFGQTRQAAKYNEILSRDDSTEAPSFESYSGLHLKSREMQHPVVTRTLEGKTILTIPQLLKTVKAPTYDPPDEENDYVVLGVICSKSTPRNTKNTARDNSTNNQERDSGGKFMVIRLTDLKHELDLFLFDTGFSQFWKLPLGTLVAILNPDIMPPRDRNTGKFSLKLASSDDTILELGLARDLDFCHATRKDGKSCESWVDSRKTEFCEFHLQLEMEKSKKGRMEINTMVGMGKGPAGGKYGMFSGTRGGAYGKGEELKREGKYHDKELHETVFIAPRPGGAAKLLDGESQDVNRGERFRKQLAEKEKERELAKRLTRMGEGSTGGDYLKIKSSSSHTSSLPARGDTSLNPTSSSSSQHDRPPDQDFSSLLNRKANDVSLGHSNNSKRKRIASGKSTVSSDAIGWSGSNKRGLLLSPTKEPASALRGTREASPAKKKARLLLPEKGIRTPGRDSLGGLDVGLLAAMDEDEDDLEIV